MMSFSLTRAMQAMQNENHFFLLETNKRMYKYITVVYLSMLLAIIKKPGCLLTTGNRQDTADSGHH